MIEILQIGVAVSGLVISMPVLLSRLKSVYRIINAYLDTVDRLNDHEERLQVLEGTSK